MNFYYPNHDGRAPLSVLFRRLYQDIFPFEFLSSIKFQASNVMMIIIINDKSNS